MLEVTVVIHHDNTEHVRETKNPLSHNHLSPVVKVDPTAISKNQAFCSVILAFMSLSHSNQPC